MCCMPSLMYMLYTYPVEEAPEGRQLEEINSVTEFGSFIFRFLPLDSLVGSSGSGAHGSALIAEALFRVLSIAVKDVMKLVVSIFSELKLE